MHCSGKTAQADTSHTAAQTVPLARIAPCSVQRQKDASPGGGGGGVAVALEGLEHGQRLLGAQLQRLADLVNDRLAARVDAEVLEGCREVRHVGLQLHAQHLRNPRKSFIRQDIQMLQIVSLCCHLAAHAWQGTVIMSDTAALSVNPCLQKGPLSPWLPAGSQQKLSASPSE